VNVLPFAYDLLDVDKPRFDEGYFDLSGARSSSRDALTPSPDHWPFLEIS